MDSTIYFLELVGPLGAGKSTICQKIVDMNELDVVEEKDDVLEELVYPILDEFYKTKSDQSIILTEILFAINRLLLMKSQLLTIDEFREKILKDYLQYLLDEFCLGEKVADLRNIAEKF